jgi:DNA polymerase III delta subunit
MVTKERPVYLLTGPDSPSKDSTILQIKEQFLPAHLQDFNFDRLYASDLRLKDLQERFLTLPVKAKKRVIVIKNAQKLSPEIKKFILDYLQQPAPHLVLVLDMDTVAYKDAFVRDLARQTRTYVNEEPRLDTFVLIRQIESRKVGLALGVLRQLLDKGERPERVLGGLRHAFENKTHNSLATRKQLRILLTCDIDIKTGRLKPEFALEKLVVDLCALMGS